MAVPQINDRSFFRLILQSVVDNHKLMMPKPFVERYSEELSQSIWVRVPDGCIWHLGLQREGRKLWIHDGFQRFMEHYSLAFGSFLVFYYQGSRKFDLYIFDRTGCEISYPANNGCTVQCSFGGGGGVDTQVHEGEGPSGTHNVGQESRSALDAATSFETQYPSFMAVLKKRNVAAPFTLAMPRRFPQEHTCLSKVRDIKLKDTDGVEWIVRTSQEGGKVRFISKGWRTFVNDNNLHQEDVCVFELICTEDPTLKVNVFRNEEDA